MAWLVCTHGDDRGAKIELKESGQLLGRSPNADVQLVHSKVSSKHCTVRMRGKKLEIEDLNSSNGIKYRNKRHKGKTLTLKLNDQFGIGDDVFEFVDSLDAYTKASEEVASALKHHKKHKEIVDDVAKEVAGKKKSKKGSILSSLFKKD